MYEGIYDIIFELAESRVTLALLLSCTGVGGRTLACGVHFHRPPLRSGEVLFNSSAIGDVSVVEALLSEAHHSK